MFHWSFSNSKPARMVCRPCDQEIWSETSICVVGLKLGLKELNRLYPCVKMNIDGANGRPGTRGVRPRSAGVLPGTEVSPRMATLRCMAPLSSFTRVLEIIVVSFREALVLA